MIRLLLAIDPGTSESAFVLVDIDDYRILDKGKAENTKILEIVKTGYYDYLVVEGMTSYNQPIGQETMDTIFLSGRFYQIAEHCASVIPRREVLQHFDYPGKCNKDSYVRVILIDRFGKQGTKKHPGPLYGITKDIIAAFAVAVTWLDQRKGEGK